MKRVILALVMAGWAAACADRSSPGDDDDAVKGGVTVHTRLWESKISENMTSAYVMLGDGSRFLQRMGDSSDVTFEDPSIKGPQDITLVLNYREDNRDFAVARTYLAVNGSDVWLQFTPKDAAAVLPAVFITGKVSGFTSAPDTFVSVVGAGVSGSARVTSDGSYRIEARGKLPAVVNLLVFERDLSGPYAKAVGMKRGVNLVEGQQLSGQDIPVDHPVDREVKLTVNGTATYEPNFVDTQLSFYQDKQFLFAISPEHSGSTQPPPSIPAISLTAPFDTAQAMLSVLVSVSSQGPDGSVFLSVPVDNLSAMTASLPQPLTLTSHTLGGTFDPGTASLSDFSFRWKADAEAQMVQLSLHPDWDPSDWSGGPAGDLTWFVNAPGSVSSFTPFRLPSEVWPRASQFGPGHYRLGLGAYFQSFNSRYENFYEQTPPSDPTSRRWATSLSGTLQFQ